MKKCSYCGRENADDVAVCLECGASLVAEDPDFVTVCTSFNPANAQLTRARLEAAGFHAMVKHELSALSMDGYGLAVGGILVQVPESESADAKEFLETPTEPANPAE